MTTPADLPPLATPAEVARALRCSPRYIQQECAAGRMKSRQIAGRYLITADDVAAYLDRQKVKVKVKPCPSGTPEPASNGETTDASGKSSGTNGAGAGESQRVLTIADQLIANSGNTSRARPGQPTARVIPMRCR